MTKNRTQVAEPGGRRAFPRAERENRQKRILYTVAGVTVALILLVLAYGLYQEYVAKPSAPVATVNGKVVSVRDYQSRVRYRRVELVSYLNQVQTQINALDPTVEGQQYLIEYFQQQLQSLQNQASNLPTSVLDEVIDEELVRQESAKRGIAVSSDEVRLEVERQFGYERNPPTPTATPITATVATTLTATPSPTPMTEEMFQQNYSQYISSLTKNAGVTEAHFRRLFEVSLLSDRLKDSLGAEILTSAEQIHVRHILVATEETANQVLERLRAGEDFAALAKELSTDTSNNEQGGDLGWFPRGQMVTEFEQAAFALQPGETSGAVQTSFGYHIINMVERANSRELDETTLASKKESALNDWLTEMRNSDAVKRYWSSTMIPKYD